MSSLKGWAYGMLLIIVLMFWLGGANHQRSDNEGSTSKEQISQTRKDFADFSEAQISTLRTKPGERHDDARDSETLESDTSQESGRDTHARIAREFVAISRWAVDEAQAHRERLAEANLHQLLDPYRLYRDKQSGMSESWEIISTVEALMWQQLSLVQEYRKEYRSRLADMMGSRYNRAEFLAAFDEGMLRSEQVFAIEQDILHEYKEIMGVLQQDPGWMISEGQLYFEDTGSMQAYNHAISHIEALMAEQASLLEQDAAEVDSAFEVLEER